MAITLHTQTHTVVVPSKARTLSGFREWARSAIVPDHALVWFIQGNIWIDCRPQQLFSEAAVRTELVAVLRDLVRGRGGLLLGRGAFWVHPEGETAGNPDAMFITSAALGSGRVRLLPDPPQNCDEIEGTPDMVLQISKPGLNSLPLVEAYSLAGIPECWLVDAWGERADLVILRHGPRGYTDARKSSGWQKSNVFGKSFRLIRRMDRRGNPSFTLEVK
jgi:hypothetical protein